MWNDSKCCIIYQALDLNFNFNLNLDEFNSTFSSPGGGGDKEGKDLKVNPFNYSIIII